MKHLTIIILALIALMAVAIVAEAQPRLAEPDAPLSERFVAALEAQVFATAEVAKELNALRGVFQAWVCTSDAPSEAAQASLDYHAGCAAYRKEL